MDKALWAFLGGVIVAFLQGMWAYLSSKRTSKVEQDKLAMEERKVLSAEASVIREELRKDIERLEAQLRGANALHKECMDKFYAFREKYSKMEGDHALLKTEHNLLKKDYLVLVKRFNNLQRRLDPGSKELSNE